MIGSLFHKGTNAEAISFEAGSSYYGSHNLRIKVESEKGKSPTGRSIGKDPYVFAHAPNQAECYRNLMGVPR